jgi:hypothetical protein
VRLLAGCFALLGPLRAGLALLVRAVDRLALVDDFAVDRDLAALRFAPFLLLVFRDAFLMPVSPVQSVKLLSIIFHTGATVPRSMR